MLQRYEIRENDMTGIVLGIVELDVDGRERCTSETARGQHGLERAAVLAAALPGVRESFGPKTSQHAYGTNRETGTPGLSGIFSLRRGGSHEGEIHVSRGGTSTPRIKVERVHGVRVNVSADRSLDGDGWCVSVWYADKSYRGYYYADTGGEWQLFADGTLGRQTIGVKNVCCPKAADEFERWLRARIARHIDTYST